MSPCSSTGERPAPRRGIGDGVAKGLAPSRHVAVRSAEHPAAERRAHTNVDREHLGGGEERAVQAADLALGIEAGDHAVVRAAVLVGQRHPGADPLPEPPHHAAVAAGLDRDEPR